MGRKEARIGREAFQVEGCGFRAGQAAGQIGNCPTYQLKNCTFILGPEECYRVQNKDRTQWRLCCRKAWDSREARQGDHCKLAPTTQGRSWGRLT